MEGIKLHRKNLESPAVRDAYHRIIATLRNQTKHLSPLKTLFLTSCHPREGKSAVAAGLAQYFSQLGFHTLLVNAQTRHTGKGHHFGLKTAPGWMDYLSGEGYLDELIVPVKEHLSYIPVGKFSTSLLGLLMTDRFEEMLHELSNSFDLVLLDGPSLEEGTDAFLMAGKADGVVLVVSKGQTTLKELKREKEKMEGSGTRWVGVLLNKVGP